MIRTFRNIALIAILSLNTGCSGLGMLTSVLPSKPAVEANLELQNGDDNQELQLGGREMSAETINETVTNNGLTVRDLSLLLLVLAAIAIPYTYGVFQLGLRTPRPKKFMGEGRK